MSTRVYWRGPFFTGSSIAIVNRRLAGALLARGKVDLSFGTDPLVASSLPAEFRAFAERTRFGAESADVTVLHEWPPRFAVPARSRYVHVQPWEFGSMPASWFEALHDDCDEIWVHSTYNRDAYLDAGIDPSRVAVIPHGVDHAVFNRDVPRPDTGDTRFRFLFVGGTIPRKGIDVLVNAYMQAFGPSDDVALLIKDIDASFYGGQSRGDELRALATRPGVPRIEYVSATWPDATMAQLFRTADCFVLPYRGEGFGLPVLEAMACGLPVIVTEGGATDDFVDDAVGWRIPSRRVELDPAVVPFPTVTNPWIREPDSDALAALLRSVYRNREEAQTRGTAAAARTRADWTWERSAAKVEERLEAIRREPPVTPKRRHLRYADPAFADDGVVVETFRRIGTARPFFVEIGTRENSGIAATFAKGFGWPGVTLEDVRPESIADLLVRQHAPKTFDLLSLSCDAAKAIWDALAAYEPRVVVGAGDIAVHPGYVPVARGVFVREDLAARAGFETQPLTYSARADCQSPQVRQGAGSSA